MGKIEWTEKTWNPVAGCTWASVGCDHCYAATMTRRLEAMGQAAYAGLTTPKHFNGEIRTLPDKLDVPLRRRKPTMWFVNSMSDLFHKDVPNAFIADVFATMYDAQWHTFQVLTKRPGNMAALLSNPRFPWAVGVRVYARMSAEKREIVDHADVVQDVIDRWPLQNVWLGTSVENQERGDERIPHLLKTPAAVRFLSCEPLLGPVDLVHAVHHGECGSGACSKGKVDWVIVGGESGPGARPCNINWIRSIVAQCRAAGVSCFVKQLGSKPIFDDYNASVEWPNGVYFDSPEDNEPDGPNVAILEDKKGGDINEFPADLRVREFPEVAR